MIINSGSSLRIKVYDAGFSTKTDGLHYFYFGNTTGSVQTKRFLTFSNSGSIHQEFTQPRISAANEALYIMSNVTDNIAVPFDIGYVIEA
jgi:hypothetical protein